MKKKGNIDDIGISSVILLFFAISVLFGLAFFGEITTVFDVTNITAVNSSTAPEFMTDYNTRLQYALDYGFLMLALGFIIFSFIQAKRIPTSRESYILALIMVIFIWIISIVASALYNEFITASTFLSGIASQLVIIPFLMPNLLYYALIYTLLVGYALYSK